MFTTRFFVSLLTISYPLTYALPGPMLASNFSDATVVVNPLTNPVTESAE